MTTLLVLKITDLEKHPLNPRHDALADDELVASIKTLGILEPVLAGPADANGKRKLLAGHRRVDGAKKAGLKVVPVLCRDDLATEGQQLEVMLVENCRRENLTAIEEAEGFHQLTLFGYKQADIARVTGRDRKTVAARLKLIKLAKTTQDRVHKGQMTIDDALAIAAFSDDKETTKKLESAAASGGTSLQYALQRARDTKKYTDEAASIIAELEQRGVPRVEAAADLHTNGVTTLWSTGAGRPDEHSDCLRYAASTPSYYSNGISYGCADPSRHKADLSDQQKARQAAEEERRAEYERQRAESTTGAKVRAKVLVDAVGLGATLPTALRDIVRGLLPLLLNGLTGNALLAYQDLANIRDEDRWEYAWQPIDATKLAGHVEDIDQVSDNVLVRLLVAALAAHTQSELDNGDITDRLVRRYYALLEGLGYELTDTDREQLAEVTGDDDAGEVA